MTASLGRARVAERGSAEEATVDEQEVARGAWRRGRDVVQVGWSGADGLVLHGLEPREVIALTTPQTLQAGRLDAAALAGTARTVGIPRRRLGLLVEVLRAHDLVGPGERGAAGRGPSGLGDRWVVVGGSGSLPWQTASLLRTAGVGRVDLGHEAVDDLDHRLGPPAPPAPPATGAARPDLVVLAAQHLVPARWGDPWRRRGIAVLPVTLERRRVLVGPLVLDPAGPCLHCLDLVRTDLDGGWPALVAQADDGVDAPRAGRSLTPPPEPDDTDQTLTALAAAVVALLVRCHLEGRPPPAGVSVEATLPWPRLDHRRWPRHPDCPHHEDRSHHGERVAAPTCATPHPRTAAGRGTMEA
ncbi:cyclodehydratase [Lapillicoccus jejuensis]